MTVYKLWYSVDGTRNAPYDRVQSLSIDFGKMGMKDLKAMGLYEWNFRFAGVPIKDWSPPLMRSLYPLRPEPDFWHVSTNSGAFAAGPRAMEVTQGFLDRAGQLLPLPYNGQELMICNILECVDCIDKERSEWNLHPITKERLSPSWPFFDEFYTPGSTLFKIPQDPTVIYVWELCHDPDSEFKACVEENKLTGFIFQPVWSSEQGIIKPKR